MLFGLAFRGDRGQEVIYEKAGGEGENRGQGDAEGRGRKEWEGTAIHMGTHSGDRRQCDRVINILPKTQSA